MTTPMTNASVTIYRMTQEIRQLKQTNAELLEVLVILLKDAKHMAENGEMSPERESFAIAHAAIAKAKP